MNAHQAKHKIKQEAFRNGLTYGKITGKTQYFDGHPATCVTLHDAVPHPLYDNLQTYARQNKIVLTIYVDGVSGR